MSCTMHCTFGLHSDHSPHLISIRYQCRDIMVSFLAGLQFSGDNKFKSYYLCTIVDSVEMNKNPIL